MPDHEVSVHQARDLAGGDGVGRLLQGERGGAIRLDRLDAAAATRRVVAEAHRVHPRGVAVKAGARAHNRWLAELCSDTFSATTGAQIPIDGGNDRVL